MPARAGWLHREAALRTVRRRGTVGATLFLAGPLALLAAACGGMSMGGEAGRAADVAGAERQLASFRAVPAFVAPGPAFDARRRLQGKLIFEIPITSEVPFVGGVERGMKQAAAAVGARLVVYPNQGRQTQWAQGIGTAIAQHADAIALLAQDPALVGPQIAQAEKAGIPVVVLRTTGEGEPCEADPHGRVYGTACVPGPFEQAGRLEADWTIAASKGKADVLVVTSRDARSSGPLVRGLIDEFETRCAACRLRFVDVPIAAWATRIGTEVRSALVRDGSIDFVIPTYDSMSLYVLPAILAAHAGGRVRIATFNGTPFILRQLQDGDVLAMDAGESLSWLGWASMDQVFRVVAGEKPVRSEHTPLRVFDDGNVAEAGRPPRPDTGYGGSYVAGYRKLWRVGEP